MLRLSANRHACAPARRLPMTINPAIHPHRGHMSYGPSDPALFERAVNIVAKICAVH